MEHRGHRHRLGFVFTALLVAAGVAVFVGLRATVHDLDHSLDHFYEQTHFADLTVVGGDTDALAREAARVAGVHAVNTRGTTTLSIFIRNGKTKVQGTVIGVPATGPTINDLSITDGKTSDRGTAQAVAVGSSASRRSTSSAPAVAGPLPAQSQQQVVTTRAASRWCSSPNRSSSSSEAERRSPGAGEVHGSTATRSTPG